MKKILIALVILSLLGLAIPENSMAADAAQGALVGAAIGGLIGAVIGLIGYYSEQTPPAKHNATKGNGPVNHRKKETGVIIDIPLAETYQYSHTTLRNFNMPHMRKTAVSQEQQYEFVALRITF